MMKNFNKSKPLVVIQCYEDRQSTLPLRKAEPSADVTSNGHSQLKKETNDIPPPPPPMPSANGNHKAENGDQKVINNLKPIIAKPITVEALQNTQLRKNGTLTRTPTPDYNKKNNVLSQIKNGKEDKAELESIESYKLKNPLNVHPKPPSNYFMKAPNGTATMKKHARPVSVTIGEYAYGGGSRPSPTKLDFLNGDRVDGVNNGHEEVSITNRLQSELALTLSRSNLRKKTEAMENINICSYTTAIEDSDSSIDKFFHARYGNNLLPLPPPITIPKVSVAKSKQ